MCEHHDGAAFIVQLGNGAVQAGCHHDSCDWDWHDLRRHYESRPCQADLSQTESKDSLPRVMLPGGSTRISDCAREIGKLLGKTEKYFKRGRILTMVRRDDDGHPILENIDVVRFQSAVEEVCQPVKQSNGKIETTILNSSSANSIIKADFFVDQIPPIKCITRCPVLIERNGQLVQITEYDRESGIYAGGESVDELTLLEAKESLSALLTGFRFSSPSDRSRAIAAIITPALIHGGLLSGRAPATLVEADKSQAGKGYFVQLLAGVYCDVPATVTQAKGVGGLEESFDSEVIKGRAFVSLDNLRRKFDSPKLESFLREREYSARTLYSPPITIDPSKTTVADSG